MGRLADRVIVVTGGGHGIGKAYCEGVAAEGGRVVVAELDGVAGEAVAASLRARGADAVAVRTDVGDEGSLAGLAAEIEARYGRCDGLVNNAAIFATIPVSRVPFDQVSLEEWDSVMHVNVKGIFLACRALVPLMRRNHHGRIVNIASATFWHPGGGRIHYNTSKAAVIGFSRTLAMEVGDDGITVNAIAPGSTLSEDAPDEKVLARRQAGAAGRAIRRVQVPGDLVGPCLFLLSDDSGFMTGQTIVVDGGGTVY